MQFSATKLSLSEYPIPFNILFVFVFRRTLRNYYFSITYSLAQSAAKSDAMWLFQIYTPSLSLFLSLSLSLSLSSLSSLSLSLSLSLSPTSMRLSFPLLPLLPPTFFLSLSLSLSLTHYHYFATFKKWIIRVLFKFCRSTQSVVYFLIFVS